MKVTFPFMGPVFAYRKFLESLGHEVIAPPEPTKKTIEVGVKHSPEFICFPFKIILGCYIDAACRGAELIVTSGGIGACRAVYYGDLSEKILRQLGYSTRVIVVDSVRDDISVFLRQIRVVMNRKTVWEFTHAFLLTVRLIYAHDKYQKTINRLRPYEEITGSCDRAWQRILRLFEESNSLSQLTTNMRIADQEIGNIKLIPRKDVLKIGLVGEIYLVMEPSTNNQLEKWLAPMGVEVIRSKYISDWITHCVFPPRKMLRQTEPYLKYGIGGHEKETIGYIMKYKQAGCDGIIHLLPFGCMPEMVTQTIIPTLSADLDLPIFSLSLDEQTGWVNNQIRIEAFIDLLWSRKKRVEDGIG